MRIFRMLRALLSTEALSVRAALPVQARDTKLPLPLAAAMIQKNSAASTQGTGVAFKGDFVRITY